MGPRYRSRLLDEEGPRSRPRERDPRREGLRRVNALPEVVPVGVLLPRLPHQEGHQPVRRLRHHRQRVLELGVDHHKDFPLPDRTRGRGGVTPSSPVLSSPSCHPLLVPRPLPPVRLRYSRPGRPLGPPRSLNVDGRTVSPVSRATRRSVRGPVTSVFCRPISGATAVSPTTYSFLGTPTARSVGPHGLG